MILLDTNVLIRMLVGGTDAAALVSRWLEDRTDLCTSAICWYEFQSGPVDDAAAELALATLNGRVLPFTGDHAREASRLWNATGRHRRMRIDAMIAAAAIVTDSRLATANVDDFLPFERLGLSLAR